MLPRSHESLIARGQLRWPGLALPAESFARYLDERCPDGVASEQLAVEDLFLAFGCVIQHPTALALFERHLLPSAVRSLERRVRDPAALEEIKQQLRVRVLVAPPGEAPRIAEYRGQGSLAAWLRVVVARLCANALRADDRRVHVPEQDDLPAPAVALLSPELAADHDRLLPIFRQAFHRALLALPPRDRTLLRLHYLDGLALEPIGVMYRVNKGTVSRWLAAIRGRLRGEVLACLQQTSGVPPDELQSLLQILQSRIEVSLRGLRDDAPAGFC